MPYGFYLRKNRRRFRKVAVQSKTPVVATYKYPKKYIKSAKKTSFAKRVNQIISRNVENKFTSTIKYNDAVASTNSSATAYEFFTWTPGADTTDGRLFNIDINSRQDGRIGNTIKLKRWIIKGLIQPVVGSTSVMTNSFVGYVDIYFGRLLKNTAPVANTLDKLYQNGNTANAPTCISTDMLNPLNKDKYKVYYHRRFKMGAASDPVTYASTSPSTTHAANNDFKLSQTFGFDVCKYILKNKHLKYDDFATSGTTGKPPDNAEVLNLTLWATFTPQSGQATSTAASDTLYHLDCLSYAEYEDA